MNGDMSVAEWVEWQKTGYTGRRRFLREIFYGQFLARFFWRVSVEGLSFVPPAGPAMIMMSHSTIFDVVLPMGEIKNRWVVSMSKRENWKLPLMSLFVNSWGAVPVNRGEVDRRALHTMIALLEAGELVLIMPEGTRTPALREAKDGLTYIALKVDVPIIPTVVWGLEDFPRSILRSWKRSDAHLRFGPPFRLKRPEEKRVPREVMSQMTREMMYQLARLYPEHKRGDYADLANATTEYLAFV